MAILLLPLFSILNIIIYPTVIAGYQLPHFGFLSILSQVPLFVWFFQNTERKHKYSLIYLFSFLAYAGCLYWFVPALKLYGGLSLLQSVLISALIAVNMALFTCLGLKVAHSAIKRGVPHFLALPLALTTMDLLRHYVPVGGCPWPMLSYSLGPYLGFFQWVDTFGALGLTCFLYLMNALITEIVLAWQGALKKEIVINRSVLLFLSLSFSFFLSYWNNFRFEKKIGEVSGATVALIQGNVEQDIKWNRLLAKRILESHLQLSKQAQDRGATLAIWPETAYPFSLDIQDRSIPFFDQSSEGLPLLMGSVTVDFSEDQENVDHIYNSAILTDSRGAVQSIYHKRHLVPFGEYVPFQKYLWFARRLTESVGDFTPGTDTKIISHQQFRFGVLICYEDIFPNLSRDSGNDGANVLVNMTNDAWYGDTSAQHQHVVFSQFRALENRRYLLRSTNTGITAIINWEGKIEKSLPPFTKDILVGRVSAFEGLTPYSRFGNFIDFSYPLLYGLILLSARLGLFSKPKGRKHHGT